MSLSEESLRVVLRLKPKLDDSLDTNNEFLNAIAIDTESNKLNLSRNRKGNSEFSFYGIVDASDGQDKLYGYCKDIVQDAVIGVNCSILAYGQTGSGKTYSMLGKKWTEQQSSSANSLSVSVSVPTPDSVLPEQEGDVLDSFNEDDASLAVPRTARVNFDEGVGIIPRCITDIYDVLNEKVSKGLIEFSIHVQVMQIYNEKIYDLLQDRRRENPLLLRDVTAKPPMGKGSLNGSGSFGSSASNGVYVQGLSEYRVDTRDDVLQILRRAMKNRAVRSTEMNLESSRSHTILQLAIEVRDKSGAGTEYSDSAPIILRQSVVRFVDLAGSEKWRATLSQAGSSHSDLQKELTNINTSLHVLGNCVSALTESGRKHIPYRDSVLTRILQDSLGGSGRTILVATISSPTDAVGLDETHSTLQFANRASKIKVTVNPYVTIVDDGLSLQAARAEIAILRDKLAAVMGQQTLNDFPDNTNTELVNTATHKNFMSPSATSKTKPQSQRAKKRPDGVTSSNRLPMSASRELKSRRKVRSVSPSVSVTENITSNAVIEESDADDLEASYFEKSSVMEPSNVRDGSTCTCCKVPIDDSTELVKILQNQVDELNKRNEELMRRLDQFMRSVPRNDNHAIASSLSQSPAKPSPLVKSPSKWQDDVNLQQEQKVQTPSTEKFISREELSSITDAMETASSILNKDEVIDETLDIECPNPSPRAPVTTLASESYRSSPAVLITNSLSPADKVRKIANNSELGEDNDPIDARSDVDEYLNNKRQFLKHNDQFGGEVYIAENFTRPKSGPKSKSSRIVDDRAYLASTTAPSLSNSGITDVPCSPSHLDNLDYISPLRKDTVPLIKAESRLSSAVEFGRVNSSPISKAPHTASSKFDNFASSEPGGVCGRHGLASCILCQLNGGSTIENLSAMNRVNTRVEAPVLRNPISTLGNRGLHSENLVGFYSTSSSGPCKSHGVASCVLCALRASLGNSMEKNKSENTAYSLDSAREKDYSVSTNRGNPQPMPAESPVRWSVQSKNYDHLYSHDHRGNESLQYGSAKMSRALGDFEYMSSAPPSSESVVNIGTADSGGGDFHPYGFNSSKAQTQDDLHRSYPRSQNEQYLNYNNPTEYASVKKIRFQDHEVEDESRNDRIVCEQDMQHGVSSQSKSLLAPKKQTSSKSVLDAVMISPYASGGTINPYTNMKSRYEGSHRDKSVRPDEDRTTPSDSIQLPSLAMAAARKALGGSVERYSAIPNSNDPGSDDADYNTFVHVSKGDRNAQGPKTLIEDIESPHRGRGKDDGTRHESWKNITYVDDEGEEDTSSVASHKTPGKGSNFTREHDKDNQRSKTKKSSSKPNSKKKKIISSGYGRVNNNFK